MSAMLKTFLVGLAFSASFAIAQEVPPSLVISEHAQKVLDRGDGRSQRTAYKVKSVREEYEVLAALGLKPGKQSLVQSKRPYDVVEGIDPSTGATREVWFDISSFYPEF